MASQCDCQAWCSQIQQRLSFVTRRRGPFRWSKHSFRPWAKSNSFWTDYCNWLDSPSLRSTFILHTDTIYRGEWSRDLSPPLLEILWLWIRGFTTELSFVLAILYVYGNARLVLVTITLSWSCNAHFILFCLNLLCFSRWNFLYF